MKTLLKKLVRDEQGQDVIEYALLAAGISIIVIPTVPGIGTAVNTGLHADSDRGEHHLVRHHGKNVCAARADVLPL